MAIYQLDEHTPQIPDSAWVADSAQVMGQVRLGEWKDKLLQDPTQLMNAYLACAQGQSGWSGAQDARRR